MITLIPTKRVLSRRDRLEEGIYGIFFPVFFMVKNTERNHMPLGRRHNGSRRFNFFESASVTSWSTSGAPATLSPLHIKRLKNRLRRLRRMLEKGNRLFSEKHIKRVHQIEDILRFRGLFKVDLQSPRILFP